MPDEVKKKASKILAMKADVEIKKDNTSAKKPNIGVAEKIDYTYLSPYGGKSAKDSSDYKRGFALAMKRVSKEKKDPMGFKYEKGRHWVGFNDNFNAGFSEGKDKTLDRKNKK